MAYLFYFICAWALYFNISRNLWGIYWFRWLKKQQREKNSLKNDPRHHLTIILPAFEEQSVAKITLDHFTKLCAKHNNVNIVIALSESEQLLRLQKNKDLVNTIHEIASIQGDQLEEYLSGKVPYIYIPEIISQKRRSTADEYYNYLFDTLSKIPSTRDIVADEINRSNATRNLFTVLECKTKGGKSDKINEVLATIKSTNNTWVGIFDFDSQPDLRLLDYLFDAIENNNVSHIQMIPMALHDITSSSYPTTINRKLVRNDAIAHLQRCFGIEYDFFNKPQNSPWTQLRTFMGASMFFKLNTLKRYLPLPTPIDDIPLGYRYQFALEPGIVLPVVNCTSLPISPRQTFRQHLRIFYGCIHGLVDEWLQAKNGKRFVMPTSIARQKAWRNFWGIFAEMIIVTCGMLVSLILGITGYGWIYLPTFILVIYISYGLTYITFENIAYQMINLYYDGKRSDTPRNSRWLIVFAIYRPLFRTVLIWWFAFLSLFKNYSYLGTKTPR